MIIRVEGDSMAPTLGDGDDILIDQGDGPNRLRDGIYVLRIDEALGVKRLAINPVSRRVTISPTILPIPIGPTSTSPQSTASGG